MAEIDNVIVDKDHNFAIICNFLSQFKDLLGLPDYPFDDLLNDVQNTSKVNDRLFALIIKLLRRARKSVKVDKWQKSLIKFVNSYSDSDAWEFTEFVFQECKISTKLRAIKMLLEAQFDCHQKFKEKVNDKKPTELRQLPIGKDRRGYAYWYLLDEECNIRIYREETDDCDNSTWELVVRSIKDLGDLIVKLEADDGAKSGESQETSRSATPASVISGEQDIKPLTNIKSEKLDTVYESAADTSKDQFLINSEKAINGDIKPNLEILNKEFKDINMLDENDVILTLNNLKDIIQQNVDQESVQNNLLNMHLDTKIILPQNEIFDRNIQSQLDVDDKFDVAQLLESLILEVEKSESHKRKRLKTVDNLLSDSSEVVSEEGPPIKKQRPLAKVSPKKPRKRAINCPEKSSDEDEIQRETLHDKTNQKSKIINEKNKSSKKKGANKFKVEDYEENGIQLRRSSRSTKGQKPKELYVIEVPSTKRKLKLLELEEELKQFPSPESDTDLKKNKKNKSSKRKKKIETIEIKKQYDSEHSDDDFKPWKNVKDKNKKNKKHKKHMNKRKYLKNVNSSDEELFREVNEQQDFSILYSSSSSEECDESIKEDDENEYIPTGRNAKRSIAIKEKLVVNDDTPCQFCKKYDQPEWILLCDTCDLGYHAMCLRPPLMIVPDGDWFCPPCEHEALIQQLKLQMEVLESEWKKHEASRRRKERLAYVNISLDNVIKEQNQNNTTSKCPPTNRATKRSYKNDEYYEDEEDDDDDLLSSENSFIEDNSCLIRSSRSTHKINYTFSEFDETISKAIGEEVRETYGAGNYGRGKDIANIEAAVSNDDSKPMGIKAKELAKKKSKRKLTALDSDEDPTGDNYKTDDSPCSEYTPSQSEASLSEDEFVGSRRRRCAATNLAYSGSRTRRKREMEDFVVDDEEVSDYEEEYVWSSKKKKSAKSLSKIKGSDSSEEFEDDEFDEDYDPKKHRKRNKIHNEINSPILPLKRTTTSKGKKHATKTTLGRKTRGGFSEETSEETEELEEEIENDTSEEESVSSEIWKESSEEEKPKRRKSKIESSTEEDDEIDDEFEENDNDKKINSTKNTTIKQVENINADNANKLSTPPSNKFSIASLLEKTEMTSPIENNLDVSLTETTAVDLHEDNLPVDELINFVTQTSH